MMSDKPASVYNKVKQRLFYVGLALDLVFLLAFFLTGFSVALSQFSSELFSSPWLHNAFYIIIFCLCFFVLHFPLDIFSGFFWEHRFGLSKQTWQAWLVDELKRAVLSFFLVLVLLQAVYAFLRYCPLYWWLWAGGLWVFVSLFLAKILPGVIIPLFYKYKSVEDEGLKDAILALFKRAGVRVQDVYALDFSAKTKKANAFVCGLGKGRRVVLSDTLLDNFSAEEIRAVVAHELGHIKHRDISKLLAVNSLTIFISLFAADFLLRGFLQGQGEMPLSDIASLPLLALLMTVISLLSTPLMNAFSCFLEKAADDFSLRLTNSPRGFISMLEKLGELNLAQRQPGKFVELMFYDHPSLEKRIQFARDFERECSERVCV